MTSVLTENEIYGFYLALEKFADAYLPCTRPEHAQAAGTWRCYRISESCGNCAAARDLEYRSARILNMIQPTVVHQIAENRDAEDTTRGYLVTRAYCGLEWYTRELTHPASWLRHNVTCPECLALPDMDDSAEKLRRLGIAHRPNEARRFA